MKLVSHNLRRLPHLLLALFAIAGSFSTPMNASAMHADMDHSVDMAMGEHDASSATESDCADDVCAVDVACLEHCLRQSVTDDAAIAINTGRTVWVPAITSRRTLYVDEPEPESLDRRGAIDTGQTDQHLRTQKRE